MIIHILATITMVFYFNGLLKRIEKQNDGTVRHLLAAVIAIILTILVFYSIWD